MEKCQSGLRYFWNFCGLNCAIFEFLLTNAFLGMSPSTGSGTTFDRPLDATLRVQGTGLFGVRLTRDWRGARSALQSNGAVAEPRKARDAEAWTVGLAKE